MEEHRVPRWINILWLVFVVSLVLTSIIIAIRLNCNVAQTLGFLVASAFVIFVVSIFAGLALYGLSILLEGIEYHRANCDDSKHYAGMGDFMR